MELVGGNLAGRLSNGPLPPREAARLVGALAQAIDHAHQAGVVHRDIKPANVLLTSNGTPKVTDFGLAKFLDAGSDATASGAILGTPAYMAPEQANGLPAGSAADVYALGAVFYECLTGRPPFRAATTFATLDQIRWNDPVPPRRLNPAVPRDFETVCLACLRKDPSKRYKSAGALADDIGRALDGRPLAARPAGAGERVWKWVRRRPTTAALAALLLLSVVIGAVGLAVHNHRLGWEVERANRGEAAAVAERERADANYQSARSAMRQMLSRLDARGKHIPAVNDLRRAQAEDALAFYRTMSEQDGDRPEVRADAARAGLEAARLQLALDRPAEAKANLERSRRLFFDLAADYPQHLDYKADLARTLTDLGVVEARAHAGSIPLSLGHAMNLWEELVAVCPLSVDYRDGLAKCHHVVGNHFYERPDAAGSERPEAAEAMKHYRVAIKLREQLLAERPQSRDIRRRLAQTLLNLSVLLQQLPNGAAEAQTIHDSAESHFTQLLKDDPEEIESVSSLAIMRMNWAYNLASLGRFETALADLEKNVTSLEVALKKEPSAIQVVNAMYRTYGTQAVLLERIGRHAEAVAAWERTVALAPPTEQKACRASLAAAQARVSKDASPPPN
jgi:tetratricopeptide (TPR) repeat protein